MLLSNTDCLIVRGALAYGIQLQWEQLNGTNLYRTCVVVNADVIHGMGWGGKRG